VLVPLNSVQVDVNDREDCIPNLNIREVIVAGKSLGCFDRVGLARNRLEHVAASGGWVKYRAKAGAGLVDNVGRDCEK
jgi:hypothetical protein